MNIDEARVLALNGAMLAEGEFRFEGAEVSAFLRPENAMIAVRSSDGRFGTGFALVGNAVRDADGFWTADWPVHAVTLQSTLPPIERLLDFPSFALSADGVPSNRTRFDLSAEHSAFAWVAVDTVHGPERRRAALLGSATAATIESTRDAEGFEFTVDVRVDEPKRGEVRAAPFTAHVRARLSFATLALAGSPLWWRGGAERWPRADVPQSGPLAEVLTLDRAGGTPYFRGTLDLGGSRDDGAPAPWVKASVSEHGLRLTPQRKLRSSQGFVGGDNYGPDLIFCHLGSAAWKEMLADGDEVELEQRGAGIGHVQGVTGRDAGEAGPHDQPITAVRIRLSRSEAGLRIAFHGQLGAVRHKPSRPPLGPEFHGDFLIPTAFLFARGIDLRGQWMERQKRLGKS